jgi:hypothetical protein
VSTRTDPAARHPAATTSVAAVSAPVWERAAVRLASLAPTVSTTTGLPAARSRVIAASSARPPSKLSRYSTTARVLSWSTRSSSTSTAETSAWLPIETNRETPSPACAASPAISRPSCPDWETIARLPGVNVPQASSSSEAAS